MTWPKQTEDWRTFASWECKDIPPDLVLSMIKAESGGVSGIVSSATIPSAVIPRENGGEERLSHAYGLMQIPPSLVSWWNENQTPKVTVEEVSGKDERAARLQIRLGCFSFASCVNGLHKYDPRAFPGVSPGKAPDNQLKMALIAYKMGLEPLKKQLNALKAQKSRLTSDELAKRYPGNPASYAASVWYEYIKNRTGVIPGQQPRPMPGSFEGMIQKLKQIDWVPIAVMAGSVLVSNYLKNSELGKKLRGES